MPELSPPQGFKGVFFSNRENLLNDMSAGAGLRGDSFDYTCACTHLSQRLSIMIPIRNSAEERNAQLTRASVFDEFVS